MKSKDYVIFIKTLMTDYFLMELFTDDGSIRFHHVYDIVLSIQSS